MIHSQLHTLLYIHTSPSSRIAMKRQGSSEAGVDIFKALCKQFIGMCEVLGNCLQVANKIVIKIVTS